MQMPGEGRGGVGSRETESKVLGACGRDIRNGISKLVLRFAEDKQTGSFAPLKGAHSTRSEPPPAARAKLTLLHPDKAGERRLVR